MYMGIAPEKVGIYDDLPMKKWDSIVKNWYKMV
jgi:hypothetical protein